MLVFIVGELDLKILVFHGMKQNFYGLTIQNISQRAVLKHSVKYLVVTKAILKLIRACMKRL